MATVILRWFNGEQEKVEQQIVGYAVGEMDIWIVFKQYLRSNQINFIENLPYKQGLFCVRDGDQFTVFDIREVPEWDMEDKAPLFNTYVCSLKFLKFDVKEDAKEKDKQAMPATEAPIIQ